jgi:hypothetical protein
MRQVARIWLAHHKKNSSNYGDSPKIEYSSTKMECLPLWLNYIGEKGRTLGKTYGTKARCYWGHTWGTHWELREHIGNLKGIKEKWKKILPPPAPHLDHLSSIHHGALMAAGPLWWVRVKILLEYQYEWNILIAFWGSGGGGRFRIVQNEINVL